DLSVWIGGRDCMRIGWRQVHPVCLDDLHGQAVGPGVHVSGQQLYRLRVLPHQADEPDSLRQPQTLVRMVKMRSGEDNRGAALIATDRRHDRNALLLARFRWELVNIKGLDRPTRQDRLAVFASLVVDRLSETHM